MPETRGGGGELVFRGDRVLVWEDARVLGMDVVMFAQHCARA